MRLRSLLFAPADQPRKISGALAGTADGVILDLEDLVAPGAKEGARNAIAGELAAMPAGRVVVRVNPRETPCTWPISPPSCPAIRMR